MIVGADYFSFSLCILKLNHENANFVSQPRVYEVKLQNLTPQLNDGVQGIPLGAFQNRAELCLAC